ncbi:hypothetical protein T4D_3123 [Trichinella pseudospiralis]|uniref:Uncharacterized protein n=1 Tax=Trichinella pseudospiralis TaxID=6337 RepID=A0A0V1DR88_TRIPS|nr:hypothetical protein T4D_3123 [Trichinella pseudospiralis]
MAGQPPHYPSHTGSNLKGSSRPEHGKHGSGRPCPSPPFPLPC